MISLKAAVGSAGTRSTTWMLATPWSLWKNSCRNLDTSQPTEQHTTMWGWPRERKEPRYLESIELYMRKLAVW